MNIRNYTRKDFDMITQWWINANEPSPEIENMPEDSTFVLEYEGVPVVSVTALLTNSKICYLENFIADPKFTSPIRKECTKKIINHVSDFVRSKGYSNILVFGYRDKLKTRYSEMGMKKTLDNISSFVIRLGE